MSETLFLYFIMTVRIIAYLCSYVNTTRHMARFRPDIWRVSDPTLGKEVTPEVLQVLQQKTAAPRTGAAIFTLLGLQVSSFGYEIYDVNMPHPIPLLKEGVKREKILRIMIFGGCERSILPLLGLSFGHGHGNLYEEVVVAMR